MPSAINGEEMRHYSPEPEWNGAVNNEHPKAHSDAHMALEMGDASSTVESTHDPKPSFRRNQSQANEFAVVPMSQRLIVDFKDVCAFVPVISTTTMWENLGNCCGKKNDDDPYADDTMDEKAAKGGKKEKERQVLFNVSGRVCPGEVLALMGPSGSGKSSLLTLLASRSTATSTGSILFDGKPLVKAVQRRMGFVSQDDMLYEQLTVYETLYYAAMLRLPRTWDKESKLDRVRLVLDGLGLAKCRDTIIGNHDMRGVSGGERKRVSIGHELLINPCTILLDEPTSGLDSTTALKLMHTLRTLASGGRTIITSIHQPSSRLYMQMDKLLLLSEGRTMYYGNAHAASHWFEKLGQPVPFGVSISDHILDLACGDVAGLGPTQSQQLIGDLLDEFEHRDVGRGDDGLLLEDMDQKPYVRQMTAAQTDSVHQFNTPSKFAAEENDDSKLGVTWFQQFYYLTSRSTRTRRFASLSVQRIFELISVSAIAGLFWWQSGAEDKLNAERAYDTGGLIFFMVLFMCFSSMFSAIFTFPSEFNMLVKERQSGMYRLSAYYFARIASDIPLDMILPSIFTIILYFMAGLRLDAGAFFGYWWALLLSMFMAQSLGLLIGATITNPKSGLTICTIVMLLTMLIAGYYVRSVPVWIDWMKYLSFIYWAWNLLLKINFHGLKMSNPAECPDLQPGEICTVARANIFDTDVNSSAGPEAGVLVGMLVFWRICVYLALRWKTTFKKLDK